VRYAEVCAGIHASGLAWPEWECAWVSEIDPFACAVLEQRAPGVPNLGDMTKITDEELQKHGPIDLLMGGTPCQSFSVAGLRKGLADPRGNLALVFLGLAARTRAKWLVWENVPGVLSSGGGRDFGSFLGALGELGYGWAYRVLDAQYFGLAQRRKRVFLVARLGDWRAPAAVLLEPESLRGDPPPSREAGSRVAHAVTRGLGSGGADDNKARGGAPRVTGTLSSRASAGGGLGTDFECSGGLVEHVEPDGREDAAGTATERGGAFRGDLETETFVVGPTAPCLRGNYHNNSDATMEAQMLVTHYLRADGFDASKDGTGRGTPLVPMAFHVTQDPISGDVCPAIGQGNGQGNASVGVVYPLQEVGKRESKNQNGPGIGIASSDEPMYTLQAGEQHGVAAIPFDTTQVTSAQNRSQPKPGDPCHPIAAQGHPPAVAMSLSLRTRDGEVSAELGEENVANALRGSNGGRCGEGAGAVLSVPAPRAPEASMVRRLTPTECERLQGMPDGHTLIAYRGKPASDGPRYRAIGNSIAVPSLAWIGRRIDLVAANAARSEAVSA
jgi:DNA (cytosine-5)-methyltransferase 1